MALTSVSQCVRFFSVAFLVVAEPRRAVFLLRTGTGDGERDDSEPEAEAELGLALAERELGLVLAERDLERPR